MIALLSIWSVGFLLFAGLWLFLHYRRPRPLRRAADLSICTSGLHHFRVISAQQCQHDPSTLILKRCAICGMHGVFHVAGRWELADLLRERSEVDALEAMMRGGEGAR